MKKQLLVTAVGEDRPGIVARLTEIFVKYGANLEDSRMAYLGGDFAAIILITLAADKVDALNSDLKKLKEETITVTTKETQSDHSHRFEGYTTYDLALDGADHEGIVHTVASFLKDKMINIHSMDTRVTNAPETAMPLFHLKTLIQVPPTIKLSELQKHLDEIARRENVDIKITPATAQQIKSLAAKS